MAYIYFNGKKYFPVKDFDNDLMDLSADRNSYFEVDELMAIPVAALNNKGYLTDHCCSGHTVGDLCCEESDKADIASFEAEGTLITARYLPDYGRSFMCWVGELSSEAYIMFKEVEHFTCIPDGWKYQHNRLSYDATPGENPMSLYRELAAALETLMAWIDTLPEKQE